MSLPRLTDLLAQETERLLAALESSHWPQQQNLCGPLSRVSTLIQLQTALLDRENQIPTTPRQLLARFLDQLPIRYGAEFLATRLEQNQRLFTPARWNWNLLAMVVASTEPGCGLLLPESEIEARRSKALQQHSALAQVARNWQKKFRTTKLNHTRLRQPPQRDPHVEELTTKLVQTLQELRQVAANRAALFGLLNDRRPRS
jgi:hypothetical protein